MGLYDYRVSEIDSIDGLAKVFYCLNSESRKLAYSLAKQTFLRQNWKYTKFLAFYVPNISEVEPVAFAHINIPCDKKGKKEDFMYVLSVVVRPQFRGIGIGKGIISHIENLSRQEGLERIDLESTTESFDFWLKNGFLPVCLADERNTRMTRLLVGEPMSISDITPKQAFDATRERLINQFGEFSEKAMAKSLREFCKGKIEDSEIDDMASQFFDAILSMAPINNNAGGIAIIARSVEEV